MAQQYTLITGAAGGLGRAFTRECASRGHNLIISDLNASSLEELAADTSGKYGVKVIAHPCSLTDRDQRQALFDRLDREEFEIYLTVNVAGIEFEGQVSDLSSSQCVTIVALNTEAVLDISRYAAQSAHSGPYYIINVSSMAGFYAMPYKAIYAASKGAVIQFSLALREEIRAAGGHITVLTPAGMRTKQVVIDRIEAQGFMGRLTTVDYHKVVRNTVDRVFRNRAVYIPGFINQLITGFAGLLPRTLNARMIYRRWKKTVPNP